MKYNPLQRILIPTDFSETGLLAVKHAAFMAQLNKADLYLLHAVESSAVFDLYQTKSRLNDHSSPEGNSARQLESLALKVKKEYCITVHTITASGNASAVIAEAVKEKQIDLVVMGTHGARGFNELFVGSNAHKTVSTCSCPVITVQTNAETLGFRNIVLPIDDSPGSRQKVNFTIKIARMYAAKIHVLGMCGKDGDVAGSKFLIKLHSIEKVLIATGVPFEVKIIRSDNLAQSAMRFSARVKADLISVLTGHESKLTGMLPGAFARQIVNHSRIPVLSIHPLELGMYDSVSLAGSNAN